MKGKKMEQVKERLYAYNPAGYCGIFLPEKVMKKLVKLTHDFELEVKRVLLDNIDDLYRYEWSLAHPNGKQKTVYFAVKEDVALRLELFKARQPEYHPVVFLGNPYSEEGCAFLKNFPDSESTQGHSS